MTPKETFYELVSVIVSGLLGFAIVAMVLPQVTLAESNAEPQHLAMGLALGGLALLLPIYVRVDRTWRRLVAFLEQADQAAERE